MISLDLLAAFWLFAIVASGSPGPATVMALAAGANVGFRRTLPLVFGAWVGSRLRHFLRNPKVARRFDNVAPAALVSFQRDT